MRFGKRYSKTKPVMRETLMWQRFTEGSRKAVFTAEAEATALEQGIVSTEHLLLGIIADADSVASRILAGWEFLSKVSVAKSCSWLKKATANSIF